MKYKEYLEKANQLAKDFPTSLEMEIIYSIDDEGNDYHKLYSTPTITQIEDLNQRSLELVGFFDETQKSQSLKDQDIALVDCNAICIN
jgi:hypothetical protein